VCEKACNSPVAFAEFEPKKNLAEKARWTPTLGRPVVPRGICGKALRTCEALRDSG
jgi:hypothetical protein